MKSIRLGDYIEQIDERNSNNQYKNVMGISVNKVLIPTKANMSNINLKSYKILNKGNFAYCLVTSRNGNKISIVYNDLENCVISSINPVFKIKDERIINPYFLFMYFKRPEFDRFARFNSWGSARETFDWNDFCDIEISLPSIDIQDKYVAIYRSIQNNLKIYQSRLDDLKLVCDAYIEGLRKKYPSEEIGKYVEEVNRKNDDLSIKLVQGVENTHNFISTRAKMNGIDLKNYKIVENDNFAYNPARINIGSIALRKGKTCIVSPMYVIFKIKEKEKLLPEYLMLWLSRDEFKHYTSFYSFGSVRDTFEINLMKEVKIPIPNIEIQKNITNIYNEFIQRKKILEKIEQQYNNICSILIKGAIQEGEKYE